MGRRSQLAVVAATVACFSSAAQSATGEDLRLALVRALGLVDAQRDSLDGVARAYYGPGGKFPELKDCLASKATDDRLASDLAAVVKPHVATDESVRSALQFLESPAGKKLAVAVGRRHRIGTDLLLSRWSIKFAGAVAMPRTELTLEEEQEIRQFLSSDAGKPVARILSDTTGLTQFSRALKQMYGFAAECGIDLKAPPR